MSAGPAQAGAKPASVGALSQVVQGCSWGEYQIEETGVANLLPTKVPLQPHHSACHDANGLMSSLYNFLRS